jgi:hypothetical protein
MEQMKRAALKSQSLSNVSRLAEMLRARSAGGGKE